LRRRFAERFEHHFEVAAKGRGLLEKQRFLGRTPEDEGIWAKMKAAGAAPELAIGTSFDDLNPPNTFLVSLDGPMDGYATDGSAFFGSGGAQNPSGLKAKLANDASAKGAASAHLIERAVTLKPNETRTIAFLYGYLPEGFELDALVARYSGDPAEALAKSSAQWKKGGMRLSTPAEPWVEREVSWHNYYLRGGMTRDSFFREPILSQGCVYQYVMGFQGAARDPLQHTLPFIFSDPAIVKGIIRYTLKEIQPDGSIPYAIVGAGMPMPGPFHPSDQEMWLLWALSEYVLATRDKAFLEEKVPLYPRHEVVADDPTVGELAMRSFRHLVDVIGVGEHGLARVLKGDWNDGIVVNLVPAEYTTEVAEKGETALNSAMACYVLDHYARLLSYLGDAKVAEEAAGKAKAQREALRAQWAGKWFRRGWLGPHLGWIGEDQIWLEPQPWAIIGGAATAEQSATLVKAVDELVRKPSPIGAMIQSKGTAAFGSPIGSLENGGVWASINGTLIWALAMKDGAMAWDEWKKNTLARHAEAYPNIWYGIWSGPDFYRSVLSPHPGETQYADLNSTDPKERGDWAEGRGFNPVQGRELAGNAGDAA
jgi:cellobiose phosphorylase